MPRCWLITLKCNVNTGVGFSGKGCASFMSHLHPTFEPLLPGENPKCFERKTFFQCFLLKGKNIQFSGRKNYTGDCFFGELKLLNNNFILIQTETDCMHSAFYCSFFFFLCSAMKDTHILLQKCQKNPQSLPSSSCRIRNRVRNAQNRLLFELPYHIL